MATVHKEFKHKIVQLVTYFSNKYLSLQRKGLREVALAAETDNLNLMPKATWWNEKSNLLGLCSDFCMCTVTHRDTGTHACTHIGTHRFVLVHHFEAFCHK